MCVNGESGGLALPVLVPLVIISQSSTFSDTFLSTDTLAGRNTRKALFRMNILSLFGSRSVTVII